MTYFQHKEANRFYWMVKGQLIPESWNEKDIIKALKKKLISGYSSDVLVNDVFWTNMVDKNNEIIKTLLSKSNNYKINITPHIGGNTIECIHESRSQILKLFINEI